MKRIDLRYPSDPKYVHAVRRAFGEFVRTAPLSREEFDDLKVALSEACANAIAHGSPRGGESQFGVRCSLTPDELVMEVMDEGPGFAPRAAMPLPERYSPSGRGIFLMQHFCDSVRVERRKNGTALIMTKRLRRRESEPERGVPRRAKTHSRHAGMTGAPMAA